MERIKRALELARQERSQATGMAGSAQISSATLDLPSPMTPAAPPATRGDDDSKTVTTTRTIAPDTEAMREGKLLQPGMIGDTAASFRLLRTRVLQQMKARGWNTLAVVSATPDEGKTFTAINLAMAIAAATDSRALLVDLDLRFPRLYRRFGFLPVTGIEDCIRGEATVAETLIALEGYPGLLVLPARGPVDHSSELIGSAKARALFRELKERYANRIVVYDLPPLLASDDALTFVPQVDAALIVVGEGRARREDVAHCIDMLKGTPILGTVLNGSRSERSAEYAY